MAPSYSEMNTEAGGVDLGAIGTHCDLQTCNRLDFLPFKCESCSGTYCLDHRTETSHKCPQEGRWAATRREKLIGKPAAAPLSSSLLPSSSSSSSSSSRPPRSLLESPCAHPKCKTIINTPLNPGVNCSQCRRQYCLSHRLQDSHDCDTIKPPPPPPSVAASADKAKAALTKFKLWTSSKNEAFKEKRQTAKPGGALIVEIAKLKRAAKGDEKIPVDKRLYVHVEAEAKSTTSKLPRGDYYYSKDWVVGRVLDQAAKSLQVQNVNNQGDEDDKKLRVFHVEGGRILSFGEKIGDAVGNGNTIVLLRGVQMTDLIEL